ncbi:MAG: hypothetical protein ACUVRL_06865 [Candidatus Saccharicenans sp.]|uniref:hypothetical protein n=1 Tax=Candidatus Saccharicenans sp. TaxID=2819258 RepID=UPI00404A429C
MEKNIFYFFKRRFQEQYDGYLNSIRESLLAFKIEIKTKGLNMEMFELLLAYYSLVTLEERSGCAPALSGFSSGFWLALFSF